MLYLSRTCFTLEPNSPSGSKAQVHLFAFQLGHSWNYFLNVCSLALRWALMMVLYFFWDSCLCDELALEKEKSSPWRRSRIIYILDLKKNNEWNGVDAITPDICNCLLRGQTMLTKAMPVHFVYRQLTWNQKSFESNYLSQWASSWIYILCSSWSVLFFPHIPYKYLTFLCMGIQSCLFRWGFLVCVSPMVWSDFDLCESHKWNWLVSCRFRKLYHGSDFGIIPAGDCLRGFCYSPSSNSHFACSDKDCFLQTDLATVQVLQTSTTPPSV